MKNSKTEEIILSNFLKTTFSICENLLIKGKRKNSSKISVKVEHLEMFCHSLAHNVALAQEMEQNQRNFCKIVEKIQLARKTNFELSQELTAARNDLLDYMQLAAENCTSPPPRIIPSEAENEIHQFKNGNVVLFVHPFYVKNNGDQK